MKKVTFLMALAVAAGMASCTAQSPKADLKTDIDSLSYAIGMARTEGLDQYLAQQGIDSTHPCMIWVGSLLFKKEHK